MDLFRQGLLAQMERATHHGRIDGLINSGGAVPLTRWLSRLYAWDAFLL